MKKLARADIRRKVEEAAAVLNLTQFLARFPRELSGGQRQRVAMGRAMVRDAKVFLFDEPLSNLDAKLRDHMRVEIRQLHDRLGTTTLYVTHDQIEAMTMADKIVAMQGGVIQQVGSPLELYDDPANVFVAGFIGAPAMTFVEVEATADGQALALGLGGTRLVTLPPHRDLAPGGTAILGIRPEHVSFAGADTGFPARVDYVEHTGLATIVHADVGGVRLRAFGLDRPGVRAGDAIHLRIDPDKAALFDAKSERRLRPQ